MICLKDQADRISYKWIVPYVSSRPESRQDSLPAEGASRSRGEPLRRCMVCALVLKVADGTFHVTDVMLLAGGHLSRYAQGRDLGRVFVKLTPVSKGESPLAGSFEYRHTAGAGAFSCGPQ